MAHVPKAQILIPLLMLSLLVASCAKRPATATSSAPQPTGGAVATAPPPATGTVPSGPRAGTTPAPGTAGTTTPAPATPARPAAPREFVAVAELKDIHFDFDKDDIRPGDARILDENTRWMKANSTHLILIEGHADERGTNEYNVALGERRAKATMNYLVAQGVQASRITIISYGEERPLCTGKYEACWARNRRAHFLVKAQ